MTSHVNKLIEFKKQNNNTVCGFLFFSSKALISGRACKRKLMNSLWGKCLSDCRLWGRLMILMVFMNYPICWTKVCYFPNNRFFLSFVSREKSKPFFNHLAKSIFMDHFEMSVIPVTKISIYKLYFISTKVFQLIHKYFFSTL